LRFIQEPFKARNATTFTLDKALRHAHAQLYFFLSQPRRFALAFYALCISTPMQAQAATNPRLEQWAKEFNASHPKDDNTLNFITFFAIIISLIVIIFALNDVAFNKSKRLKTFRNKG